eukprot:SAG31_NODE_1510_length_8062_cov_4.204194_7_plen_141_part_00
MHHGLLSYIVLSYTALSASRPSQICYISPPLRAGVEAACVSKNGAMRCMMCACTRWNEAKPTGCVIDFAAVVVEELIGDAVMPLVVSQICSMPVVALEVRRIKMIWIFSCHLLQLVRSTALQQESHFSRETRWHPTRYWS